MVEWRSADWKVRGLFPRSVKIFSIYLNEELNQKVNNNNNNASNSLVFGLAADKNCDTQKSTTDNGKQLSGFTANVSTNYGDYNEAKIGSQIDKLNTTHYTTKDQSKNILCLL